MDPYNYIRFLLDWSCELTESKTPWIIQSQDNKIKIKELASLKPPKRSQGLIYDINTKPGGGLNDLGQKKTNIEILSNLALPIMQSKLWTSGISAVTGKYFDPKITKDDVNDHKEWVRHLDSAIDLKEGYYDKLKDLAIQKRSLLEKRIEYADIMISIARLRKKVVDAGIKIETAKNKMVAAEKIASTESKLKDLEREYNRKKKDLMKKAEQLEKERDEVNEMWDQLKTVTKAME